MWFLVWGCYNRVMRSLTAPTAIILLIVAPAIYWCVQNIPFYFKNANIYWHIDAGRYAACELKDNDLYRLSDDELALYRGEWVEVSTRERKPILASDIDKLIDQCSGELQAYTDVSQSEKAAIMHYQKRFKERSLPFLDPSVPIRVRELPPAIPAKGLQMDLDSIKAIQKSSQPVH